MPLRNRVDPSGEIRAVPARGEFFGNRGCIHNDRGEIIRRAQVRRWIVCLTEFKGRRRPLLRPGHYTELFFLDEVTAFAAGHRPCFECRRSAARAYAERFAEHHGLADPKVDAIDALLDAERTVPADDPSRLLDHGALTALPDGAMVRADDRFLAAREGLFLPWSFDGYGAPVRPDALPGPIFRVTPPSTLAVLARGYRPAFHSRAPGDA
jgi:hypothetical protein